MRASKRHILFCCAALMAINAGSVQVARAEAATVSKKKARAVTPARAPVNGREGSILGQSVPTVEEVSVKGATRHADGTTNTTPGGGLMPVQTAPRSQSGVTKDWIAKQTQTGNISSMIQNLPGVVYANQSPLATAGDHITMRGMNESQIGYLFEGAPLADPINYEPYTSMLVDTENLGSVTVSQGAPDLNAPLFNAVGGQISATEMNPGHHFGGYLNLMGGTHSAQKEFMRLETGDIGNTGIRGFASFSYLSNNNWRGPGGLTRYHVDSKFVKEWGEGNSVEAIFGYNRQKQTSWREPTAAQWKEYGTSLNYTSNYYPGNSKYYKLNFGELNSMDIIVPSHFTLSDHLTLNVTPYYVHQYGPSVGGENIPASGGYYGTYQYGNLNQPYSYTSSSGTQMLTTTGTDPWNQKTAAVNMSMDWTAGNNTLSFGYWYSYTMHEENSTFSVVDSSGLSANAYGKYPITVAGIGQLSGYNLNFMQQVNTLYLADSLKLLNDKLTISAGFRAAMIYRQGTNNVPGADPYKTTGNYFEPLPQFAISYQLTPHDQIYANATTSFRAPESVEAYSQIFDPNSSHAVEQPGSLKSEYTIAEELGYRHTDKWFNFQMSLFNINLTNHQVTSSAYIPNTNMLISEPINVGGMTSRGIQGEIGLKPWHHFSPYFSAQYLHSTMDNNVPVSATDSAGNSVVDYLPTAGKTSVGAPHVTFSAGLSYDDGKAFFGNFSLRYIGYQYSTFMNDQKVPAYVVSDITLGYRFPKTPYLKGPKIQLNLINVGNNIYRSSPGSYASTAQARTGIYGNSVSAGSPVYLVGGNFAALVALSTGF